MELQLKKSTGSAEQVGFGGQIQILLQPVQGFAEGKMLGKFHEADQVAATLTTVAVKQIFSGVDIERGFGVGMQGAQSYELLAITGAATAPVTPLQILQQRNPVFELFQISIHKPLFPRVQETKPLRPQMTQHPHRFAIHLWMSAEADLAMGMGGMVTTGNGAGESIEREA